MDVYAQMRELFETNKLGVPPVPEVFRSRLRRLGEWAYATCEVSPLEMFRFDYPRKVMSEWVPDYLAISHAGRGLDSYAVNYEVVLGPLALFAQVGYGGVYGDPAREAGRVRRMFEASAELVAVAAARPGCGRHRLLVLFSDLRNAHHYQWLIFPGDTRCPSYPELAILSDDPVRAFRGAARRIRGHR